MSNEEESLDEFECALSEENQHFLIEPILLINCGHSACKSCISNKNTDLIKCNTCSVVTEIDLKSAKVSAALKKAIKYLYESMFRLTEKEIFSKLNHFKSIFISNLKLIII
jgi:hypothetical protein